MSNLHDAVPIIDVQADLALVDEIKRDFEASLTEATYAKDRLNAAMIARAKMGINLLVGRTRHRNMFVSWVTTNFPFSIRTAQRAMVLGERYQDYLRDDSALSFFDYCADKRLIDSGLQQLSLLPEPHREPGSQTAHVQADDWIADLGTGWARLSKRIEQQPVASWSPIKLATLEQKLKPYVDLYHEIKCRE